MTDTIRGIAPRNGMPEPKYYMTHECPATACDRDVSADMLMCRSHWYMVPRPLQRAVRTAWQDGTGAGSPAHTAAIRSAIRAVNDKLAAKGITSTPGGAP